MDIRKQLLEAFRLEHREHIDAIRAVFSQGAAAKPADWTDVFRRAHSLKGAARAVDLPPIEAVAHRLESLFERMRAREGGLDPAAQAAAHLALDRIEAYVGDLKSGSPAMPADAAAALDRCLDADTPLPAPAPSEIPEPEPSPALEPEQGESGQAVLRVPAASVEAVSRATHGLTDLLARQAAMADDIAGMAETAARLRRIAAEIGARIPDLRLRAELVPLEAGLAALARSSAELSRGQRAHSTALDMATFRLREATERLSLVPAETVFGGFARAVRDTAREQDRAVEITVRGLDLPIDRAMLQALKDPVLHVLRNTLSHGYEPPEVRRAAGKPGVLSILFEVTLRGGRIQIGIHDDGRGPDLGRIEAKARALGLLAPGQRVEAETLLGLVFEPGFSTAPAIDTLSGRGIGLAVVADAMRRLNGQVRLTPRQPCGASLVMSLPLSAAQRSLLLVEAGNATYALPGSSIERLLLLDEGAIDIVMGRPVARIPEGKGEATVPVVELSTLLGGQSRGEAGAGIAAVLLRAGERRCVLAVERLAEVRTLLVLPAPPIGVDAALVSGTAILGNYGPVLVFDAEGLIARAESNAGRPSTPAVLPARKVDVTKPDTRRSTILVVDDSITTRTLEKSILESAGYRVVVCVDGQDALERLRSGIETIDVVVADVEMPRLDGFGLLQALRAEESFATLPVVLMTSRGASEDVTRGLELGADAYLTKQKFDQRELLDTIGQLL